MDADPLSTYTTRNESLPWFRKIVSSIERHWIAWSRRRPQMFRAVDSLKDFYTLTFEGLVVESRANLKHPVGALVEQEVSRIQIPRGPNVRFAGHPKAARSAPLFSGADMLGAKRRPVRALDPMELKRTDPLRFLIQAYCFSPGVVACEAAAAPVGGLVSGSARNADDLRHLRRGYEIVVAVARHDRQPRLRQLRVQPARLPHAAAQ